MPTRSRVVRRPTPSPVTARQHHSTEHEPPHVPPQPGLAAGRADVVASAWPSGTAPRRPDKDYKLVRQVVDVLAEVDANYVRELSDADRQKLVEDMINGGLQRLDPHSEYLNADELEAVRASSEGNFGGVGIHLGIDPKTKLLKVDHPMPGTPAYDAGVVGRRPHREGRRQVDRGHGRSSEAEKLIQGEPDTTVTLTIRREGEGPSSTVTLTRGRIEMHPVAGRRPRAGRPDASGSGSSTRRQDRATSASPTFSELTTKELRAAVDGDRGATAAAGWSSTCATTPAGCSTRRSRSPTCS